MRTDAKIGFAIVGVLVAVLAVYLVVIPKAGRARSPQANAGPTVKTQPEPAAPNGDPVLVPPAGDPADPLTPATPATKPVEPPVIRPPVDPIHGGSGGTLATRDDHARGGGGGVVVPPPVTPHGDDGPTRGRTRGRHVGAGDATVVTTAAHPYRVRPGQTLSSIAAEVYGNSQSWRLIAKVNPKVDPNKLRVGTTLVMPDASAVHPHPDAVVRADVIPPDDMAPGTTYTVKPGDSLYRIARYKLGSGQLTDELYAMNRDEIGSDPTRLRQGMVLRLPATAAAPVADSLFTDVSR